MHEIKPIVSILLQLFHCSRLLCLPSNSSQACSIPLNLSLNLKTPRTRVLNNIHTLAFKTGQITPPHPPEKKRKFRVILNMVLLIWHIHDSKEFGTNLSSDPTRG